MNPDPRLQPDTGPYARLLMWFLASLCVGQLILLVGCHRGFYRRQADNEVRRLIDEKATSPRWSSIRGDVEIDPRSRMFDPFSADHPPIPPDDPTSHKLLHKVDNKKGYPHWHANGDATVVDSPYWQSYLSVNEKGQAVLSLSDAYELALINSPDLQAQRETLYLSALEVSLQRFGFDTQLFAGFNSFFTRAGSIQGGGAASSEISSSLGANGEGINASKLGITGTTFMVGLANTILWEFSGNNTQSANSLINFSIIQPLLSNAGRERILESLTQSERTLLANVRQLERFRRGFYLQVATGRSPGAGAQLSSPAFLAPPGLAGSGVGGYMGLLLQQQQIRNFEFNVAQFESLLTQFRALFATGRIDSLQVAQFETNVYTQQENLLNARVNYEASLDAFKVLLGLPPDLEIVIEDPYVDRFELIDDQFTQRLAEIKQLRELIGAPVLKLSSALNELVELKQKAAAEKGKKGEKADTTEVDKKLKIAAANLKPYLGRAIRLVDTITNQDRNLILYDLDRLSETRHRRVQYLDQVRQDIRRGVLSDQLSPEIFEQASVPEREALEKQLDNPDNKRALVQQLETIQQEFKDLLAGIQSYDKRVEEGKSVLYRDLNKKYAKRIPDMLTAVDGAILEMALIQANARANIIEINDVTIEPAKAFETARCLRRDWMNARAALVDQWRQIEFVADQLEAGVNLVFSGEVGNDGDNPFRLDFDNGNLQGGFQFDSPIVRQQERNDYRAALINYQQARRDYYQFEDSVNQSLRQTIRNLKQDKLLFELNRQSILVNINGVLQARARVVAPPAVGQTGGLSDVTSQNLTFALNTLTGVQNNYLELWVEYEVLRRFLDFDMGTMQLDSVHEWVDPGYIDQHIGLAAASREGVSDNEANCCGMFNENIPTGIIETHDIVTIENGEFVESLEEFQEEASTLDYESLEPTRRPGLPPNWGPGEIERLVPGEDYIIIGGVPQPLLPVETNGSEPVPASSGTPQVSVFALETPIINIHDEEKQANLGAGAGARLNIGTRVASRPIGAAPESPLFSSKLQSAFDSYVEEKKPTFQPLPSTEYMFQSLPSPGLPAASDSIAPLPPAAEPVLPEPMTTESIATEPTGPIVPELPTTTEEIESFVPLPPATAEPIEPLPPATPEEIVPLPAVITESTEPLPLLEVDNE